MHDEQERAAASTRRLPAEAVRGLREAFAQELAERLPRLRHAVDSGDDVLLQAAVRDAHSLGSSAAVVGLADASRSARAAEAVLLDREPGAPVGSDLRHHVNDLHGSLAGWRP